MVNKMMRFISMTALALLLQSTAALAQQDEWNFRVFLDDREIGTHDFTLQRENGLEQVSSAADFEYKLLFVKLYDYQHRNTEHWQGDCLVKINSRTDANGDKFKVQGSLGEEGFLLETGDGQEVLPTCVMTFAYWNPEFLNSSALLNSQNGELLSVEISDPEPDQLMVRGSMRAAFKYRLQAGEMNIRLWYSESNEWLALETDARGGRVLRYELL